MSNLRRIFPHPSTFRGKAQFCRQTYPPHMTEEYFFFCPYCWQQISFILDLSVVEQTYIEDCEVCCNPIEVHIQAEGGEVVQFEARGIEQ